MSGSPNKSSGGRDPDRGFRDFPRLGATGLPAGSSGRINKIGNGHERKKERT